MAVPVSEHVLLLDTIAGRRPEMRKSEQKVADAVLADPGRVVREGVADLARRAGVSEPTVMRFASGLGFSGYQDFKITLAQCVALGIPITQSNIDDEDDAERIVEKIFTFSVSSLVHAQRSLDVSAVQAAIDALASAEHLVICGFGASSVVALDAQQKFPLFGIPCSASVDPQMLFMAAETVTPTTVVLAISNTGSTAIVVDAVSRARARGATTIAITGDEGPLTSAADIVIRVRTPENTDFYTPTTSRLAHLAVIDVLATAVALRQPESYKRHVREAKARLAVARAGYPSSIGYAT